MSIRTMYERIKYFDRRNLMKNLIRLLIALIAMGIIIFNTPIMEKIKIRRQVKLLMESVQKPENASPLSSALAIRKFTETFTQDGNIELTHDQWQETFTVAQFVQKAATLLKQAKSIKVDYNGVKIKVFRDYLARAIFEFELNAVDVNGKSYYEEGEVICLLYRIDREWRIKTLGVRNKKPPVEEDTSIIDIDGLEL